MTHSQFSSAVTGLLEIYSLQRDFQTMNELDLVLEQLMQATANDTCVWVSIIANKIIH